MFYAANGKFIIKENFETDEIKTKSKNDNSLDVWHYDVNGNLKSGTKVSKNGNYEIWTGYCYDENCTSLYGNNKPNLIVDKDGTTTVENKLCINNECISRNQLKLSNMLINMVYKGTVKGTPYENIEIENLTDADFAAIEDNLEKEKLDEIDVNSEDTDPVAIASNALTSEQILQSINDGTFDPNTFTGIDTDKLIAQGQAN